MRSNRSARVLAGKLVKVTGKVHERGGSKAVTLEQIEEVKE